MVSPNAAVQTIERVSMLLIMFDTFGDYYDRDIRENALITSMN